MVTSRLYHRSSMFFDSMAHLVPSGHEKPLRQALYTAIALLIVVMVTVTAISVYFVLEIFIKPLLWAVLCGFFLFPFKHSLNSLLSSWLRYHVNSGRPLSVGLLFLPFILTDGFSEQLGKLVTNNWKVATSLATCFGISYILHMVQWLSVFNSILLSIWQMVALLWNSTSVISEILMDYWIYIFTGIIAYFVLVVVLEPKSLPILKFTSGFVWMLMLLHTVVFVGGLQVPLSAGIILLATIGALSNGHSMDCERYDPAHDEKKCTPTNQTGEELRVLETQDFCDIKDENSADAARTSKRVPGHAEKVLILNKHQKNRNIHRKSTSSSFFSLLFFVFSLTMIWIHVWLISVLILLFLYWGMKRLFHLDVVKDFIKTKSNVMLGNDISLIPSRIIAHLSARTNLLLPTAVKNTVGLALKGDKRLSLILLKILPTVTSIVIILALLVSSISISLFLTVKIQQESVVMVQITSDMINETVSKHPEYKTFVPDNDTMQKTMDSLVDNAYVQGREWIKKQIHSNLGKHANVSHIEKQALRIWDSTYNSWFNKTAMNKSRKPLRRQSTAENLLPAYDSFYSGLLDLLYMTEVIELLKDNMSALMSLGESMWSVLHNNIRLVLSFVSAIFTILLSGGSAILNFVLALVIFFTTLFYLLVGSDQQYIPMKWIGFGSESSSTPSPIATAIQDAISGVFGASIKMASFYGLYTWLNHTIFGAYLVYVPTVLAAVFSVIPVFPTYWSCVLPFFDIWFVQGDVLRALALLVIQFLPTMFVDTAIYSEMSESGGGHPYITGLAVVGGMYCFGLEGAIIGPILLCILLVAMNIYSRIINLPVASDTKINNADLRPSRNPLRRSRSSEG